MSVEFPHREYDAVTTRPDNLAAVRRYLAAIESGASGDALAAFFTPDVVQQEFPNRLTPNGQQNYDCFEPW